MTAVTSPVPVPRAALAAAVAAVIPPLGAAATGATSPVIGLVTAATLPVVTLLAATRRPLAPWAGAAHLLLLPLALLAATGADLRLPLTGALLAVAGLHAGRVHTDRDRAVAVGIQLAVLAATLSQLGPGQEVTSGLLVGGWGTAVAVQRQLAGREPPAGAVVVPARSDHPRRVPAVVPAVAAALAVAGLLWALFPQPGGQRQATQLGGGDGRTAEAPPAAGATPGGARVGLDSGDIDLSRRGAPSDRPVLQVAGAPGLWRAQVLGSYDGRGWRASPDGSRRLRRLGSDTLRRIPAVADDGDASVTSSLTVRLLAEQRTVVSPGRPEAVTLTGGQLLDGDGDVLTSALPVGTTYTVLGGTPADAPVGVGALPHDADRFLALPAELPQRVRDLAATWTADATAPLARAEAVSAQLRAGYTYRLDSPVPAAGRDAVDDLLFVSHSGFCEQFASAEAVLLRALGVPTRLVSGYAGGPADADGTVLVRDADAHAWVEVWVAGRGWIAEDPTAGVPLAPSADRHGRGVPFLRWLRELGVPGLVALALGLVTAAGVVLLRRRRRRSTPPPPDLALRPTPGRVAAAWAGLEAVLAAAGSARSPSETPAEVLLRVPGGWDARGVVLPPLEREVWGPGSPTEAEAVAAEQALHRLAATLAPVPA